MSAGPELRDELLSDPLGRGYAAMSDADAADDLNQPVRTRPATAVSAMAVFSRFDAPEYHAAITNQQNGARNSTLISHLLSLGGGGLDAGGINPADPNVVSIITTVFGNVASSKTTKNLTGHAQADAPFVGNDLRLEYISRAEELGLRVPVRAGHVAVARS